MMAISSLGISRVAVPCGGGGEAIYGRGEDDGGARGDSWVAGGGGERDGVGDRVGAIVVSLRCCFWLVRWG